MKHLFKYPLNIQFFAEGGDSGNEGTGGNETGAQVSTPQIDYDKMAEAISKRTAGAETNLLRGYLKQQGLSGEELDQAVNNFKTQKQQAAAQARQDQENMKLENQRLKAQILNSNIDSSLTSLAVTEGVSAEKIPFLLKLVERKELANEKGEIIEEKAKEELSKVLKAFPDFKGSIQQNNGFQQIGGGGTNEQPNALDDKLDSIFGIKKK